MMKVSNSGRHVSDLPSLKILRHEDSPGDLVEALDRREAALAALDRAAAALRVAEAEAAKTTVRVAGERARYDAEIRAKTRAEYDEVRAAERASTAAATEVVRLVEEHRPTLRAIGARLALAAHARRVDAAVEESVIGAEFSGVVPAVKRHALAPDVAVSIARGSTRSPFQAVDLVNVEALAEIAGEVPSSFGFVLLRGDKGGEIWTTPARARMLTANPAHGQRWRLVEQVEEVGK